MQEKLDGVPGIFTKTADGTVTCLTRQGHSINSVPHIVASLDKILRVGDTIVGELYNPNIAFKDISGAVRRNDTSPAAEQLGLYVWDFIAHGFEEATYVRRVDSLIKRVSEHVTRVTALSVWPMEILPGVYIIPGIYVQDALHLTTLIPRAQEDCREGVVLRTYDGKWRPGKRSRDMLKLKWIETADLPIVSLEEAHSADTGEPLSMVGRVNVLYNGTEIGAGPGALTHEERKDMWERKDEFVGKIVEIKYMPDPTYDALREARVVRLRGDKDGQ